MNSSKSLLTTLRHVWTTLDDGNLPMAVVGGIAAIFYQHVRLTQDVDLLVAIEADDVGDIIARLRAAGVQPKKYPPLVSLGDVDLMQFLYEPPDTHIEHRIDLMIGKSEFHQSAMARRVKISTAQFPDGLDIVAPEDLVIMKLIAGRIIDRVDAAYIVRFNRDHMDVNYLTSWCAKLDLRSELSIVWDEAFPGESPPESPPASGK